MTLVSDQEQKGDGQREQGQKNAVADGIQHQKFVRSVRISRQRTRFGKQVVRVCVRDDLPIAQAVGMAEYDSVELKQHQQSQQQPGNQEPYGITK
ncbi:hypothetical protein A6C57_28205 (plasmid) [Fibrella sp. ES10-3-2-2]